jgi:predicted Zn-dependent peptidase
MPSTFVTHTLPSGLRIVCEVLPGVRSAAAGFLVMTGARHEHPHEHGVSHFLEHMCFKGTPTRSCHDITVRFDELGSIYNAFTGKEHTIYYGWVPGQRIEPQIELLADMLRPALPPDDYETERKVILEEIAMKDDSFDSIVWNYLHDVIFGTHSLGHEILGEKATIEGLPRETMVDYHRRRYASDNVVLVASGAIEPERVLAAAGRYCEHWRRGLNGDVPSAEPPALPTGVFKNRLERFKQQTIILVYPGVPVGHPFEETIDAFCGLFGGHNSRCYWNIVQKGIAMSAGAAHLAYQGCGYMCLYADGEPDRCEQMLAALREQAREVSEQGFTAEEVQRIRNQRRTQLALEAENPRTRIVQVMDDIETRGQPRQPETRLAAVEAVTERSIAEYLRRFPITGDGLMLSCGPRDWP